ncbi:MULTISPECIES: phage holin family protein [Staphylococcus]|jgi:toxin secretion/phage lysis holin|uniref:phage holin family protein n=1 Tax=Staphylococcus TaxID=1279 RepID=UPI00026BFB7D|nr:MULTISPECIES: phage holin family protein [Staphylococcus]EJD81818.1 toxin secretion/phage lysis holin [Staphylococcus epidermidis NIHLM088]EJD88559.1 toxin secretion/phage lysis holin [Staphylococcus epidermidis NIHLM070]MDU2992145.1 phage holin family protein [Streptococcus mitis]MDU6596989.1 phage holin family protein [Veillonella sp.]EJE23130.1 toxin secretion/phage lysis holin [Staphylococcus epidermidis NIHLM003]
MDSVKNFDVEVNDFMSLIYSGNYVFIDLLLLMIFIDIITGILKAFSEGKLWSHKAISGYIKKIAYLCIVLVANALDIIFRLDGFLVNSSVIFLIIAEATSIVENAVILGVPIPEQLKKRLIISEKLNNDDK